MRQINERVKVRQREISLARYEAKKELIEKGELTLEAMKGDRNHLATIKGEFVKTEDGEVAV